MSTAPDVTRQHREPRRVSPAQLKAFRTFLKAYRRMIDEIERRQNARDLPLNQYDVLVHLSEAPGWRLRMQDLADTVNLSKSGLTRLVDRMEDAGLVNREVAADDARGVLAVMTDNGFHSLVEAVPAHREDVVELFAALMDDAEAAQLTEILERILQAVADGADAA